MYVCIIYVCWILVLIVKIETKNSFDDNATNATALSLS